MFTGRPLGGDSHGMAGAHDAKKKEAVEVPAAPEGDERLNEEAL